jgi:acyl carrier protein
MDHINNRLVACFKTVFPDLQEAQIPGITQAAEPTWDSVAAITLANVIEDEFQIEMDLDLLPELDSFDRILVYLQDKVSTP